MEASVETFELEKARQGKAPLQRTIIWLLTILRKFLDSIRAFRLSPALNDNMNA